MSSTELEGAGGGGGVRGISVRRRRPRWRRHRKLSQLDLAIQAEISTRHLSYMETGRAWPSRGMVLRLADQLDVTLRERNELLLAAGYAPAYGERPLDGPDMAAARSALDMLLAGHEPYPAIVIDRWWNMVTGNRAVSGLLDGIPTHLLREPINVMRLLLHPEGMAAGLSNLAEVRPLMLDRLSRQVDATGDAMLKTLYDEVCAYQDSTDAAAVAEVDRAGKDVIIPLRFATPRGELSLFSTVATFGAPADITLSELAIELLSPADESSAAILRELTGSGRETA